MCFHGNAYAFLEFIFMTVSLHLMLLRQIEILLGKTEKFDELMAAAAEEREAAEAEEEQS